MLKGQDLVVMLAVAGRPASTMREVADRIAFDPAGVLRSLRRLSDAGLYDRERSRVPLAAAEECLIHGVRYFFPPRYGGEARGIPTAWAAEPLAGHLAENGSLPPVWPYALGTARGIALEPIHDIVVEASLRDEVTARRLTLLDGVRVGHARERQLAVDLLHQELRATAAT